MFKDKHISRIYFLGIGGIGMSAIARYFNKQGVTVSGYDKTRTALTIKLEQEGISINYSDELEVLDKDVQMVIYTPAIHNDNKLYTYFKKNNYTLLKRSDILGMITEDTFNICIAGTHGKTTISTMITHILWDSKHECNAFLGGISLNYETNFLKGNNNVSVVEADEYDRSFLKLKPNVAIISSMDADHLEIYGDKAGMLKGFMDFTECIRPGGLLIMKYGLQAPHELSGKKFLTYSLHDSSADVYAQNISVKNGSYTFDVSHSGRIISNVILNMGGMHNIENAVAAVSAVASMDIDDDQIRHALSNFKGIKRRFEYVVSEAGHQDDDGKGEIIFIDDYAHHPQELSALIKSVKELYPSKHCMVIFQPHLFSRTKEFAAEFAKSLDLADSTILLPIYPARELPMAGVTSELILKEMKLEDKHQMSKSELLECLKEQKEARVIVTAGAGDIDQLVEPIREIILSKRKEKHD